MRILQRLLALLCTLASFATHADDDALGAALAAERARPTAPAVPRHAFLARPAIEAVTLSPDGRQLAYIQTLDADRVVLLLAASGSAPRRMQVHTTAHTLHWSDDARWLLLESAAELFAVPVAAPNEARIITTLGNRAREERSLLRIDPTMPAGVLLLERTRDSPGVAARSRLLRVDMQGSRTLLHEDAHTIIGATQTASGRLAFLSRGEAEHIAVLRVTQQRSGPPQLHEILRCERLERCTLLPLVNSAGELLLHGNAGGALNRVMRLDANGTVHTQHMDPRAESDLDQLVLDPRLQQPMFASYRSTGHATHGLTPEAKQHLSAIQQKLPRRDLSLSVGRGANAMWLVEERDSRMQLPRRHLYDPHTHALREILQTAPLTPRTASATEEIPTSSLARQIAFSYRASDGMRLHGFLTVPSGAQVARLPLIANVHGGPWNHVRAGYHNLTQLLANRGYAVFEPNFRGSTGYGRDYLLAARGDFGNGRVQQDIADGIEDLLERGIGDPQRVGIIGASFGGYSTLLGVTFRPDLFRVGVAVVPPTDFAANLHWVARSSESLELANHVPFTTTLRLLSLDLDDLVSMRRLQSQSPLANAAKVQRPLLLIAGGADRRVPISNVVEYAARLRLLGKDVSLLVDADATHSNSDPVAREAYLYLLESMLARHLGGKPAAVADSELRKYLDRNLRIRGTGLSGP